jgi:hypothetical protein
MRQNYLFIPSFVFCAMKHSLTKAQFGEVISSVADSVYSNDDAPSSSIIKGSDKYAFHYIVVEATKMQGASGRSSRPKSVNGLLLPMMNLLAMHDNLTNSDLAEVVFKAADYAEGMQIESFDKSSAMAAHFSMLVRSMDLQPGANKAKPAVVEKKGKSSSKAKVQKSANADKAVVSDETADLPENTETATDDNFAESPDVTFDDISAKFSGSDSEDYLDKSRDIWSSLTIDEQRAAFGSVVTYLSNSDTKHYLYQYLSHKAWLAD